MQPTDTGQLRERFPRLRSQNVVRHEAPGWELAPGLGFCELSILSTLRGVGREGRMSILFLTVFFIPFIRTLIMPGRLNYVNVYFIFPPS